MDMDLVLAVVFIVIAIAVIVRTVFYAIKTISDIKIAKKQSKMVSKIFKAYQPFLDKMADMLDTVYKDNMP